MDINTGKLIRALGETGQFDADEIESIVEKLNTADEVPKKAATPFYKPFDVFSEEVVTINGKSVAIRKLKFTDALYIAQAAPQAVIHLFGKSPEEVVQNMDEVEIAYKVFFGALTTDVDGEITDFAVMVMKLLGKLLSNQEVTISVDDIMTADPEEIFTAFEKMVLVNVDFFVSMRRIMPGNITRLISYLAGMITNYLKPISTRIESMLKDFQSPQDIQDSGGGTSSGLSTSGKRHSKKSTRSKKSKTQIG